MFILLQTENTPQKMRVSVKDLIRLPKADFTKQTPKRRVTSTAPEYHLTGEKSIKFIEDADKRKKQKDATEEKFNKIKVEAVKEAKAKERRERKAPKAKSRSRKIKDHPRL